MIGPNADDPFALLGCYSFPAHIGVQHPELPIGVELPTVLDALRAEFPGSDGAPGTRGHHDRRAATPTASPTAVAAAADAEVVVAALGDRAGLFGRGTCGEGCDAASLRLPGVQAELLEALLDGHAPVFSCSPAARTRSGAATGARRRPSCRCSSPARRVAPALAGVLSGRVNPSGRLPVSIPATPDGQPWTYLAAQLALASEVSNLDPTPAYPFGRGLGYTLFGWSDLQSPAASSPPTE